MPKAHIDSKDTVWALFDVSWDPLREGLSATLKRVTERCAEWFSASGASLFLNVEGTSEYVLVAKSGIEAKIPDKASFKAGEGIAGACIANGTPMLVGDPLSHPALKNRKIAKQSDVTSAMVVPLVTPHSGPIGVLNLSRHGKSPKFSESDLSLASSIVYTLALAVANARLFSKANAAVAEARATQARLQDVLQTLGVAVIVLGKDMEVTNANPQALRLLNHADHEASGLRDAIKEALFEAAQGAPVRRRFEEKLSQRSWSMVCTPMTEGGASAAIEEVTDYERTLTDLNRLSRLAEIGQMTAAIAHEIRNPLTGILSSAQMVKTTCAEATEFAEIIEDEATKLNTLCNEFLEFAKPLALRMETCKLGTIAKALVSEYSREFEKHGIHLKLEIDRREQPLEVDSLRIEQVMRNLLNNAYQACYIGGTVLLQVGVGWFSVSDDGTGISGEQQAKLFTPFFTTKAQGTGLGLSNVRKIVDAHRGKILVDSEEGKGTRFEVRLLEAA